MTTHLKYLEIFADYLISNGILDNFLEAYNTAKYNSDDADYGYCPIHHCFVWVDTKEGGMFWRNHNNASSELLYKNTGLITITQKQVIDYLYSIDPSIQLVDDLW